MSTPIGSPSRCDHASSASWGAAALSKRTSHTKPQDEKVATLVTQQGLGTVNQASTAPVHKVIPASAARSPYIPGPFYQALDHIVDLFKLRLQPDDYLKLYQMQQTHRIDKILSLYDLFALEFHTTILLLFSTFHEPAEYGPWYAKWQDIFIEGHRIAERAREELEPITSLQDLFMCLCTYHASLDRLIAKLPAKVNSIDYVIRETRCTCAKKLRESLELFGLFALHPRAMELLFQEQHVAIYAIEPSVSVFHMQRTIINAGRYLDLVGTAMREEAFSEGFLDTLDTAGSHINHLQKKMDSTYGVYPFINEHLPRVAYHDRKPLHPIPRHDLQFICTKWTAIIEGVTNHVQFLSQSLVDTEHALFNEVHQLKTLVQEYQLPHDLKFADFFMVHFHQQLLLLIKAYPPKKQQAIEMAWKTLYLQQYTDVLGLISSLPIEEYTPSSQFILPYPSFASTLSLMHTFCIQIEHFTDLLKENPPQCQEKHTRRRSGEGQKTSAQWTSQLVMWESTVEFFKHIALDPQGSQILFSRSVTVCLSGTPHDDVQQPDYLKVLRDFRHYLQALEHPETQHAWLKERYQQLYNFTKIVDKDKVSPYAISLTIALQKEREELSHIFQSMHLKGSQNQHDERTARIAFLGRWINNVRDCLAFAMGTVVGIPETISVYEYMNRIHTTAAKILAPTRHDRPQTLNTEGEELLNQLEAECRSRVYPLLKLELEGYQNLFIQLENEFKTGRRDILYLRISVYIRGIHNVLEAELPQLLKKLGKVRESWNGHDACNRLAFLTVLIVLHNDIEIFLEKKTLTGDEEDLLPAIFYEFDDEEKRRSLSMASISSTEPSTVESVASGSGSPSGSADDAEGYGENVEEDPLILQEEKATEGSEKMPYIYQPLEAGIDKIDDMCSSNVPEVGNELCIQAYRPILSITCFRKMVRFLHQAGFKIIRTTGSHHILQGENPYGEKTQTTVPLNKSYPADTVRSIFHQVTDRR